MTAIDRNHETRQLGRGFFLIVGFMVIELVTGLATGSLALISDAAHMGTDALGLGMALAAFLVGRQPGGRSHTFGYYRLEILAALANTILLFGVALFVIFEGWDRLNQPQPIDTIPVLVVATAGLLVNVVGLRWLHGHSLNMVAARSEVVADLLASIGVVVGTVVVAMTGWLGADALVAILIGLLILPRAWSIGRQAIRVLVQAAPEGLDLERLKGKLSAIGGVVDLHDVHVWTLTSGMDVASAHLMVEEDVDSHSILDQARYLLQDEYGIAHATLQVEPSSHVGCVELHW